MSFVMTDEFSVRLTKITSRIGVSWTCSLFLIQWIMTILPKGCKPDHFESHNSLNFSFTNICGLFSYFIECESFLESNSLDILAQCETNLDDSVDSGNFSLPFLIKNDCVTHMHGLAVYVKEGIPLARDLY